MRNLLGAHQKRFWSKFNVGLRGCLKSRHLVWRGDHHHLLWPMLNRRYDTDLTDASWALVAPLLPAAKAGGRPRTTDLRAILNAIFYLLRSGCQWRLLPREFPPWSTVYYYFRSWDDAGVWVQMHRALYEQVRRAAGRETCPSVVIMDGQSIKTTERGGIRGFDGHKRVKGRKTPHPGRHVGVAYSQPNRASEYIR